MARILFIVPPLAGHVNPTVAVAQKLVEHGHTVAWVGHCEALMAWLPNQAQIFSLTQGKDLLTHTAEQSQKVRGLDSIRFLFEQFLMPMARASLNEVREHVNTFQPDLLVVDQQMLAGALVAREGTTPWIGFATTTAAIRKSASVIDQWIIEQLHQLQMDLGYKQAVTRPDISPYAMVVFSSELLLGEGAGLYQADYHFVGPAIRTTDERDQFPWHKLSDDKPRIFISLGTVSRDRNHQYYQVMMEALHNEPVQVVMVAQASLVANAPDNFIVMERVPQMQLLPFMDAVVCHAGHNTVCESLWYGIPMVVSPIRDDQPVIAQQVVQAGAGVFLRFGRATVNAAKTSVKKVLEDKSLTLGAQAIQSSFKTLGGSDQVVAVIESQLGAPG